MNPSYQDPPTAPGRVGKSELPIYEKGDIKITNLRAVFGAKTYSISNITSVERKRIEPNGCLSFGLVVFGVGLILVAFINLKQNWQNIIFGGILVAAGFAMSKAQKASYAVALTTASGEIKAYTSDHEESIKEIIVALNNAIIQKG